MRRFHAAPSPRAGDFVVADDGAGQIHVLEILL
jgi:hypothetical protein